MLLLLLSFLRILPVLILSRFAVHKGPDEQDGAADERYEAEEHVPAAFADVVEAPDGKLTGAMFSTFSQWWSGWH